MGTRKVTEGRLRSALHRLLDGKPERVKRFGKLSLNRINNEAGLGHSYIHKFEDFVKNEAIPAIEEFNKNYDPLSEKLKLNSLKKMSEVDSLKVKLKKEVSLKEKYRNERDETRKINKILEQKNSSLMFRIYELQEELKKNNVLTFTKGQ